MSARKAKPQAHDVRDQLTTRFIEELQRDFAEHGREIVEKVRTEAPSKYAELILRLIPLQPTMVQADDGAPRTSREIAEHLLRDVGLPEASDDDCRDALLAYDQMMEALTDIRDRALH